MRFVFPGRSPSEQAGGGQIVSENQQENAGEQFERGPRHDFHPPDHRYRHREQRDGNDPSHWLAVSTGAIGRLQRKNEQGTYPWITE